MPKVPGMKAGSLDGAAWGKTPEEARAANDAAVAARRGADAADVEKRQPRAFGFLEDGDTVEVDSHATTESA